MLILSNEPWGNQWFSKHHYANELSKLGHQVYYVNPPGKWNFAHLFNSEIGVHSKGNNLNVVEYKNPFPIRLFRRVITYLNDFIVTSRIKRKLQLDQHFILWQFDFLRWVFFPNKEVTRIYHVADPYMHAWSDEILARKAKKVLCTSPKYVSYYGESLGLKNVTFLPHGVSDEEQETNDVLVNSLKAKYGKFSLLIGSINDDLNFELIDEIQRSFPIVILGGENLKLSAHRLKWSELKKQKNVTYLGAVDARELKNYVAAAQVGLLTYSFDLNKSIGSGSPLKVLNYMAQYKPMISSIHTEIPDPIEKGIFNAQNISEYINHVGNAMKGELTPNSKTVNNYLSTHSYPKLIEKALKDV